MRHTLAVLVLLSLALPLRADGVFMLSNPNAELSAETPRQQAAIIRRADGRELLIVQPTYYGPPGEFAWIVPVPGLPGPGDLRANVKSGQYDPGDVQTVLTNCLIWAAPGYRTTIHEPSEDPRGPITGGPAGGAPMGVTVYSRVEIGQYHAAVLSATQAGGLLIWLHDNHFPVPDRFAAGLQAYVNRGWYFVAFRLRADFDKDTVGSADLEPVAITFPTDHLIYPLTLTGLASAPRLSLLLAVVTDRPVTCTTFPTATPAPSVGLPAGSCYGSYRREILEAHPGGVLLREGVWRADREPPEVDSSFDYSESRPGRLASAFEEGGWVSDLLRWNDACLSRFFTVLPRGKLQDLVFVPDPSPPQPYITLVVREARPQIPWWAHLYSREWLRDWTNEGAWWQGLLIAALLAGMALFARGKKANKLLIAAFGLLAVSCVIGPPEHSWLGRTQGSFGFTSLPRPVEEWLQHWAEVWIFGLAVAAILLLASFWARERRAAWAVRVVVLLLVVAAIRPGPHWFGLRWSTPKEQLAQQTRLLSESLDAFTTSYGAYPTSLAQLLTQTQPQGQGQDAAGNPVTFPVKSRFPEWESTPVPVDPLTGRADTWILDPLDPEVISSGGFTIRVSMARDHTRPR